MRILVTGGAGYIGSHLVKNLLKQNYQVIILDNLSTGSIAPVGIIKKNYGEIEFIKADLADKERLAEIFANHDIDAVMHLAAKIDVNESVKNPNLYHEENYINSINLVEAMTAAGCDKLIFSSTAAVYGNPQYIPIDENHPTEPTNPYGQTKLDFEKYLSKVENLKYIILRYFNVGGSDPAGNLGRSHLHMSDLIENIFKVALGQLEVLKIFGKDYETKDGTPIRDFVNVEDVASVHILALEKLESVIASPAKGGINSAKQSVNSIFNLGSENGFSVKEIVDKASLIIGQEIPTEVVEKRAGDITVSVASAKKAKEILDWNPQYSDLDSIIRTDWNWRRLYPLGY